MRRFRHTPSGSCRFLPLARASVLLRAGVIHLDLVYVHEGDNLTEAGSIFCRVTTLGSGTPDVRRHQVNADPSHTLENVAVHAIL